MSRQKKSVDLSEIEQKFDSQSGRRHAENTVPAATLVKKGGAGIPRVSKLSIREVDPEICVPWEHADRVDESWFQERELEDLVISMRERGQDIPAVVRPAHSGSDKEWELIAGRRRWAAAKLIPGFQLRVVVQQLSDAEAASLMNSENMDRTDISEFERAISFRRLLDAKVFPTAEALLAAMPTAVDNLNKVKLSNMLRAAEIYEIPEIRAHLTALRDVRTSVALAIARLLDESGTKAICKRYCASADPRELDTKFFLKGLLGALKGTGGGEETVTIEDEAGRALGSLSLSDKTAKVQLDRAAIQDAGKMAFIEAMRKVYDELGS